MQRVGITQQQPLEMFYKISCSKKICNIQKETPALESLFHKVAGLQTCNFTKKKIHNRGFLVNIAKFLRTPILKNIYERLLPNYT